MKVNLDHLVEAAETISVNDCVLRLRGRKVCGNFFFREEKIVVAKNASIGMNTVAEFDYLDVTDLVVSNNAIDYEALCAGIRLKDLTGNEHTLSFFFSEENKALLSKLTKMENEHA